jgi:methyl-accepting chemotaxis protein/methyl-accepting chemotaxis protein-1 (serine sensor receptor)
MTLNRKLILAFGSMAAILLLLSVSIFFLIGSMDASYVHATESLARKQALLGDINTARADLRASLRATILYTYAQKPELVESNRQKTEAAADRAMTLLEQLQKLSETDEGRAKVSEVSNGFKLWKEKFETIYELCKANNPVEAEAYGTRETKSIAENTGAAISRMQELVQQQFEEEKAREHQSVQNTKVVSVFAILLCIVLSVFVLRVIMNATSTLSQIAMELNTGAEQLASAAMQISSSSQSLAQGASEQAASLEETSSSTTEIVSMTGRNAENSKEAMALMDATNERILSGNQRLEEMNASMQHINSSAEKISKIIKTIDEIAFQTNILALNAAVEAARAGEAGMGFAVVADEVRNLAQRCAQAAKDTASLIEESIQSSQQGSEKLSKVAEAIIGITEEAEKVRTLVTEVSMSSQEQANGLQQISKAITEMELVTQRSASGAEQTAAAGQQLTAQSQALNGIVKSLNAIVHSADEGSFNHTSITPAATPSRGSALHSSHAPAPRSAAAPKPAKASRTPKPPVRKSVAPEHEFVTAGADDDEWKQMTI